MTSTTMMKNLTPKPASASCLASLHIQEQDACRKGEQVFTMDGIDVSHCDIFNVNHIYARLEKKDSRYKCHERCDFFVFYRIKDKKKTLYLIVIEEKIEINDKLLQKAFRQLRKSTTLLEEQLNDVYADVDEDKILFFPVLIVRRIPQAIKKHYQGRKITFQFAGKEQKRAMKLKTRDKDAPARIANIARHV